MKRFYTLALMATIALGANAQTDSLSMEKKNHRLQEVVVKSDVASTTAEKSVYLPSKKQRNAATDAVALLQHMMIPQIQINPMAQDVKTNANEEVCIFIDFMPATKEDLQGMNTQDVKRVEVYNFPTDVRFQNKQHVVNFIMQKYEIGGYTKLSTTDMLMSGKDYQTSGSVYSKMAFKQWTLDANISDTYSDYRNVGSEMEETFRLPAQTIVRSEIATDGRFRTHRPSASLRATFNSEKIQLANCLEFLYNNTPTNEDYGTVAYQPSLFSESNSLSSRVTKDLTSTYIGDWNFFLPKQWRLNIAPKFQYSHNKQNRFYQEGESQSIENRVKEDASQLDWQIGLGKTFAQKHTIYLGNYGMNYNSRMDYSGSTAARQDMKFLALGIPVVYNLSSQRLRVSLQAVAVFQHYKVNGMEKNEWSPLIRSSANYAFNEKNSLSAEFSIQRNAADGAKRNPSILQSNEILYYSGNPLVENYNVYGGKVEYTWMPSNIFTVSTFAQYYLDKNYYANVYETYLNGTAMLRRIENVGDVCTTSVGTNLTLRLLDGNLQINASPRLDYYSVTGRYDNSRSTYYFYTSATYYIKQFNIQAFAMTQQKYFSRFQNAWYTERPYYYISAGWGNAHWKANLTISNPFRTDWRDSKSIVSTPVYSFTKTDFDASSHQRLNLSLTYTFNYGKKVKQGNELEEASGGKSSIL